MALFRISFFSDIMCRNLPMYLIMPDRTKPKAVFYLLHGFGDSCDAFIRNCPLERLFSDIPVALVMPEAENSFYADTVDGRCYWSHISEEINVKLSLWFGFDFQKEKSYVCGISMGGYGAAKLAFNYPERFSGVYLISPVTDIVSVKEKGFDRSKDVDAPTLEQLHLDGIFGTGSLRGTSADLYAILGRKSDVKIPPINIYAGREDFLSDEIQSFYEYLTANGISCHYYIGEGRHMWLSWQSFIAMISDDIKEKLK